MPHRKKVVSVFVVAQEINERGERVGPAEYEQIFTLNPAGNDYRITSVFWGNYAIESIWAPMYDNKTVTVEAGSPLMRGHHRFDRDEEIATEKFIDWWQNNEEHYLLCKGANCQPCNPK